MDTVSRNIGHGVTETLIRDFDKTVMKYGEFVKINQFALQPKHVSEVGHGALTDSPDIEVGDVLYGIEEDGSLTWLGQIID